MADLARTSPQFWDEYVNANKAAFSQHYGPLLQKLGLPPESRERARQIVAAQALRSSDITAAGDAQQLAVNDPVLRTLLAQSEQQTETELRALLGERGYAEYKDYDRAAVLWGYADGLAVQVARVDPLSAEQAERLVAVLGAANSAYRNGKSAVATETDWAMADEGAQAILTPGQFAIWKKGTAPNPLGGTRLDGEMRKLYGEISAATKAAEGKPK